MRGLDGGEGGVGVGVRDVLLSDGVAGHTRNEGGLLFSAAISESERDNIDTARNILQVSTPHSEEGSNKPAADSRS